MYYGPTLFFIVFFHHHIDNIVVIYCDFSYTFYIGEKSSVILCRIIRATKKFSVKPLNYLQQLIPFRIVVSLTIYRLHCNGFFSVET